MSPLLQAIAIMALGKLLFAIQDAIIKELSGAYPMHEIMSIRGLIAIPILLVLIYFTVGLKSIGQHRPGYHLLRGFLMFSAFMAFYVGLTEISLTTATALFFTAPFFITLLSVFLLGERVGSRRIAGIVVGFVGVLIVLRPDGDDFKLVALLPVVAAALYATCQVLVRFARLTAPPSIMSLYASITFALLAPITGLVFAFVPQVTAQSPSAQALYLPWTMPDGIDILLLTFTGLTSALGFMFMSRAYQSAEASQIAPFEYIMIVWVTILSYLIWDEIPDLPTLIGIAVIILSGIYVMRREERRQQKPIAYTGLTRR